VGVDLPEIAVLDTHALLWWMGGPARRLGRRARAFVDRVDEGRAVACIPVISLVEMGEAIRSGGFSLDESFARFVERLDGTPSRYQVVPLTVGMAARAHDLFAIPERGDRLIAATALELGYPLVTRDPAIATVIGDKVVW